MAQRMFAHIEEVDGSHTALVAQSLRVADLISRAVAQFVSRS